MPVFELAALCSLCSHRNLIVTVGGVQGTAHLLLKEESKTVWLNHSLKMLTSLHQVQKQPRVTSSDGDTEVADVQEGMQMPKYTPNAPEDALVYLTWLLAATQEGFRQIPCPTRQPQADVSDTTGT